MFVGNILELLLLSLGVGVSFKHIDINLVKPKVNLIILLLRKDERLDF